jgi:hypothetical protein
MHGGGGGNFMVSVVCMSGQQPEKPNDVQEALARMQIAMNEAIIKGLVDQGFQKLMASQKDDPQVSEEIEEFCRMHGLDRTSMTDRM